MDTQTRVASIVSQGILADAILEGWEPSRITSGSIGFQHTTIWVTARPESRRSTPTPTLGIGTVITSWVVDPVYAEDLRRSEEPFRKATDKISALDQKRLSWQLPITVAPYERAIEDARRIIPILQSFSLPPVNVFPSAEGGVAFSFERHGRYSDIDWSNSGQVTALISDGNGFVETFNIHVQYETARPWAVRLTRFLDFGDTSSDGNG